MITLNFTDNLLREPQAPEHIAMNESWDKMDSQAIRLAEVALMLMMTICSQNHIPTFIVLCHCLGNPTKFCVFYTKTFIMTCLFCPNLLHTCNVLAMYLIHTWTGPHRVHGLNTKQMYKLASKNCCGNKSLILVVQTRT